jgi:hypothetical protein
MMGYLKRTMEKQKQEIKIEFEIFKLQNVSFKVVEIAVDKKINAEEYIKKVYTNMGVKIKRLRDLIDESHNSFPKELIKIRYNDFRGMPDFLVIPKFKEEGYTSKAEDFFFIEVKTNGDGLRVEQIEWMKNHPELSILVLYLKQKLNDGNDGIPPKPKVLGILPKII